MRRILLIATTALAAGCASNDYQELPTAAVVPVQRPAACSQDQSVQEMDPSSAIGSALTYVHQEGREYKAFIPYGRVVPISLIPGDTFREISAVDFSGWRIDDANSGKARRSKSILLVSSIPGEARRTQAVVVASDRVYLLDLIPRKSGHTSVSFHKPQRPCVSQPPIQATRSYSLSGPSARWRPMSVTDDGQRTTVQFPQGIGATGMPVILAKGPDGEARPVNSSVHGDTVIVHSVYPTLLIRSGNVEIEAVR